QTYCGLFVRRRENERGEKAFRKLGKIRSLKDRAFLARSLSDLYGHLQSILFRNDSMGMAASLESRFPFLGNPMVELGLHMPLQAKYRNRISKWVVKETARQYLPSEIVDAPKNGFVVERHSFETGQLLLKDGLIWDLFGCAKETRKAILERVLRGPDLIFPFTSLEIWARIYIGSHTPEEVTAELLRNHAVTKN
ncbi:MAG: hypothetical protein JW893_03990, partial [Candidatus Omnitrophica bacterium]|nr:hypothetical protein [Candidatus Omnitrophota bacterium]